MIRAGLVGLARACHALSCVPLFILIVITSMDVVARYAFKSSVLDTAEISGMLLGIAISLALAATTHDDEQVRFDLVVSRMSPRARRIITLATLLVSAVIFGLIAWGAIGKVLYSFEGGEFTGAMEIPIWPAKLVFAFGCLMTALILLARIVSEVADPSRDREPPTPSN